MWRISGSLAVPRSVPPKRQPGPDQWRCQLSEASQSRPGPPPCLGFNPSTGDSDFPVTLPVMTLPLPGAQTQPPSRHPPQTETSEVYRNSLPVFLEPLESHRQGWAAGHSHEKRCSVSGLQKHARAEEKGPQLHARHLCKRSLRLAHLSPCSVVTLPRVREAGGALPPYDTANRDYPLMPCGSERRCYIKYSSRRSSDVPQANVYLSRIVTL